MVDVDFFHMNGGDCIRILVGTSIITSMLVIERWGE